MKLVFRHHWMLLSYMHAETAEKHSSSLHQAPLRNMIYFFDNDLA